LKGKADFLESSHGLDESDVAKHIFELNSGASEAKAASKVCNDFVMNNQLDMSASARQDLVKLLTQINECTRIVEEALKTGDEALSRAREHKEKLARKAAALKEEDRQSSLFANYDRDGDGMLNRVEVVAFVKEHHQFDLQDGTVHKIMATLANGKPGVLREQFSRMRTMVNIAREEARVKRRRLEAEQARQQQLEQQQQLQQSERPQQQVQEDQQQQPQHHETAQIKDG